MGFVYGRGRRKSFFSIEVCRVGTSQVEKMEVLSGGENKSPAWDEEIGRDKSFSFEPLNNPSLQTNVENQWISPFSTKQVHVGCQSLTSKMSSKCVQLSHVLPVPVPPWDEVKKVILSSIGRGGIWDSEHCLSLCITLILDPSFLLSVSWYSHVSSSYSKKNDLRIFWTSPNVRHSAPAFSQTIWRAH